MGYKNVIRKATEKDIPQLVEMARALVQESPAFDHRTFVEVKTREFLTSLLQLPDGIMVVADNGCFLVGAMLGAVGDQLFSYRRFAFDCGLFILPEYRGGLTAVRLIRAFEKLAKELGAEDFRPGIMTGIDADRTTRLYERLGYTKTGTQLIKVW